MESVFAKNIFYCVLLVLSCLTINGTLKRFGLLFARVSFIALSSIVMLYVPFYFFGTALAPVFGALYKNPRAGKMFIDFMRETMEAPSVYFKYYSTFAALCALIVVFAVFCILVRFVHYAKDLHISIETVYVTVKTRVRTAAGYVMNDQNKYKTLLRLRN